MDITNVSDFQPISEANHLREEKISAMRASGIVRRTSPNDASPGACQDVFDVSTITASPVYKNAEVVVWNKGRFGGHVSVEARLRRVWCVGVSLVGT